MSFFFIIGAQKCGTSFLYNLLRQHPNITMTSLKETNFFNRGDWEDNLSTYENYFSGQVGNSMIRGEACPLYAFKSAKIAPRLHKFDPKAKIIFFTRAPVHRAYSQYWDNRRRLLEHRSFEMVWKAEIERLPNPGYFRRGRYGSQLNDYLRYFPKENTFVRRLEDMEADLSGVLNEIYSFLGIQQIEVDISVDRNESKIFCNPFYRILFNCSWASHIPHRLKRLSMWGSKAIYRAPSIEPSMEQDIRNHFSEEMALLEKITNSTFGY